jgi:hypothetical protein
MANLPGVLYGFEILSAIFSVSMLENRVLRTILQPKKDEVAKDWRRLLRSFIIHITYQILFELSDNIIYNGMDGTCSTVRERRVSYRVLAGKPEGKRPLGRRNHTCLYIQIEISKILFGEEGGEVA